jgi:hypothetical protein
MQLRKMLKTEGTFPLMRRQLNSFTWSYGISPKSGKNRRLPGDLHCQESLWLDYDCIGFEVSGESVEVRPQQSASEVVKCSSLFEPVLQTRLV